MPLKIFFQEMLEKLLLRKFCKIIRKTPLVAFILKKFELSNPPTYNYRKTESAANTSLFLSRIKIGLRANFKFLKVSLKLTEKYPGSDL